jgi:hypothetical protein
MHWWRLIGGLPMRAGRRTMNAVMDRIPHTARDRFLLTRQHLAAVQGHGHVNHVVYFSVE